MRYGLIYSIKLIHCGHYSQVSGRTKEFLVDGVALASLLWGDSKTLSPHWLLLTPPQQRGGRGTSLLCVWRGGGCIETSLLVSTVDKHQ